MRVTYAPDVVSLTPWNYPHFSLTFALYFFFFTSSSLTVTIDSHTRVKVKDIRIFGVNSLANLQLPKVTK